MRLFRPFLKNSRASQIEILNSELERRKARNARYSSRGFARFLGLHPSALCRVLAGKQILSSKSARLILNQLKLDEVEARRFIHSVARQKIAEVMAELSDEFGEMFSAAALQSEIGLAALPSSADAKLVDFLPQPTWILMPDGSIGAANEALKALTGLAFEESTHWRSVLGADDAERFDHGWRRAASSEKTFELAVAFKRPDGAVVRFELRTMPIRGESGEILRWLVTARELAASGTGRNPVSVSEPR